MELSEKEIQQLLHMQATTDFDRRNKWIACQNTLELIHKLMIVPYQGIALVDAQLVVEDRNIIEGNPTQFKGDLSFHLTQSYLWVLGAYEIIRTISQFADSTEGTALKAFKDEVRGLKHKFERLRVPLAKFEAARKNPTGYTYAYPEINTMLGTSWRISNTESISRRELSDEFLQLMEKLP
ncbi:MULTISPECIES: hypothetical protein [Vibrio]|uniref:hypothetical protein n=1 Tax=Vibrio TaxID=662 RepID=UPI0020759F36|nr:MULTISPECIES: hypothetical protein [Vibrio]USD33661.1 hypothetical protein J8Z27_06035 [Vibrio sp. SCSIO 43186]USD46730.1 hypothetical protein J4N38_06215 [Vibrio sp. SCSIO 43145]USD70786.1 hypothetical protein J4N41_06035 [Vibrio sp. SCSIO 43139]USD95702.1 hypothetical protein CTT30_06120 [Vibrio coralliilyticus]